MSSAHTSTSLEDTPETSPVISQPVGIDEEKADDIRTPTDSDELSKTQSIAEQLPLPREILFVSVVVLAQFTTQVGLGQVLSILHIIGRSFGITDGAQLSWLVAGYSLTVGSFILISGRLGDMFGHKKLFVIGFAWFSLWSMIAGLAVYSNHVLFIFARVLQGIGPAITLPNGLALLGAAYAPGQRKNMIFALFGAAAPGGAITGSVFAALFALKWWPWAFWSFAIALAFITVTSVVVIPDTPRNMESTRRSLKETLIALDLAGALLGVISLVLINFAWNQGPIVGWTKPYVYICLIIGVLLGALFFYVEMKISPEPLIPFEAITVDVGYVLACVACGWGCFGIFVYYTWDFLTQIRDLSPLTVAAQISPFAISGACAAILTGFLLSKLHPSVIMTIALSAFLVGTILIGTAPVGETYWARTFVCTLIIPFGMDMSFPAATLIMSNSVDKKHQGVAASLVNTIVNYSISLALGFAGTVEAYTADGGLTGADRLAGIRHAFYMAYGLAAGGLLLSIMFMAKCFLFIRKT